MASFLDCFSFPGVGLGDCHGSPQHLILNYESEVNSTTAKEAFLPITAISSVDLVLPHGFQCSVVHGHQDGLGWQRRP